jgi:hypothetical protein
VDRYKFTNVSEVRTVVCTTLQHRRQPSAVVSLFTDWANAVIAGKTDGDCKREVARGLALLLIEIVQLLVGGWGEGRDFDDTAHLR